MFDEIVVKVVNELGPTGILVLGVGVVFYRPLRRIAEAVETINHNSTEIKGIIKRRFDK